MNGYYILAIVFIAVAACLVVTYHLLRFFWGKNIKNDYRLYNLKNFHFKKLLVAIIIIGVIGAVMFGLGIAFDETAEKELVQYTTRYDTMVGLLNNGDFYKYGGNEIARMCAECAEWKKTVDYKNDRYGRFSSYYAIKDNVECAFIAEVNE